MLDRLHQKRLADRMFRPIEFKHGRNRCE
jgi:hypothetical protein